METLLEHTSASVITYISLRQFHSQSNIERLTGHFI